MAALAFGVDVSLQPVQLTLPKVYAKFKTLETAVESAGMATAAHALARRHRDKC